MASPSLSARPASDRVPSLAAHLVRLGWPGSRLHAGHPSPLRTDGPVVAGCSPVSSGAHLIRQIRASAPRATARTYAYPKPTDSLWAGNLAAATIMASNRKQAVNGVPCDNTAIADTDDSTGVVHNSPRARIVIMDDAAPPALASLPAGRSGRRPNHRFTSDGSVGRQ